MPRAAPQVPLRAWRVPAALRTAAAAPAAAAAAALESARLATWTPPIRCRLGPYAGRRIASRETAACAVLASLCW